MHLSATPHRVRAGIGAWAGAALVLGLVAGPGAATDIDPPVQGAAPQHQASPESAVTLSESTSRNHYPDASQASDLGVEVTLITGDTVRLMDVGDGLRTFELDPGTGREAVEIHQTEIDGELHVLPLDVIPYLAEGDLDEDLFNVDLLVEAGYDDASSDVLPLITTYHEGKADAFGTSAVVALEGVEQGPTLKSVDAHALTIAKDDADDFWVALTGVAAEQAHDLEVNAADGFTSGVERIWLDRPVLAHLHESTGQIGAPTAWDAGIDGTGVTVAVLDSGVDAEHPDLAGQVTLQEDFTDSGNLMDHVGHGTHVAAIAAGTGDGSDGARRGVAPGATIISGKVLDDEGVGTESGVIAGMEWAVEQQADIVNLSLGGAHTDGTDPLSQALNVLSEQSETLFVVSAGNDGPGSRTISSPGSADAALTVGAVDRDESLANFSSRGPRIGDQAVKPDITAPGVGIVAARAEGTDLGTPVDDLYTAVNGTSMAAPHVAGAAALLAAQHPEWDGDQLKDALISTAQPHPDLTTYEQGGGRVDVTRAITQPVTATGTLHLGTFEDGDTGVETHEISYTNTGTEDLVLDLTLDLATAGGEQPADGAVVLSDDTVTVPAEGTAAVTITVDPAELGRGQFTGTVLAEADDITVRTTLALVKAAPTHEVTFRGVTMDGEITPVPVIVLIGATPEDDVRTFIRLGDESTTVTVAEGDYFLHALINDKVDGLNAGVVVTDPELEITEETEVLLDAREATQVQIETPEPATIRGNMGYITHREFHGRSVSNRTMKLADTRSVWVTPTEEPTEGSFEFSSRWQLGAPVLTGTAEAPHELEVLPEYERYSPILEHDGPLQLIDAGAGTPQDYEGIDVEGKVAVVSLSSKGQEDIDAAVEAGAAALMIAPEIQWATLYTGPGDRLDLPVVALTPLEGQEVLAHLADGELQMSFSGSPNRPYTYDVMQVSQGKVPEEVVHTVTDENSTTLNARYHYTGGDGWTKEQRFGWMPSQETTIVETQHELFTPQERTEIISSGDPDARWRQHVLHFFSWENMNPIQGGASHATRTYEPGAEITAEWYRSVNRPAVPAGSDPVRTGDIVTLHVPEFATGDGSLAMRSAEAQTTMSLWQDGELLHEDSAAWGDYPIGDGTVQLDLSAARDQDADWQYSTSTDTSWSFDSSGAGADVTTVLPLLRVDYDIRVDLDNTVPAGAIRQLDLSVRHPEGLTDAPAIPNARVWVSYDEGEVWQEVAALHAGPSRGSGNFTALVVHPQDSESVSLRVEASDSHGNTIEQTVVRAYGIDSD